MKEMIEKKFGAGSLSLVFSILAIACSFTYINSSKPIGAIILNYFGIYKMTVITSVIMFIFSIWMSICWIPIQL